MVRTTLLPKALAGQFFGVGSLGETDPSVPVDYIKKIKLPYAFSVPALPEEDMIRQFGYLSEGFENDGHFILDVDIHDYREMISNDDPLMLNREHGHSYYLMKNGTTYPFFKTQQTAPATMCFSIRGSDGKQHLTQNMFHYYLKLMERIAIGQVQYLSEFCETLFLCQDDPALEFVAVMAKRGRIPGLTLKEIVQKTDSIYPENVIPAFHYCDDWRRLNFEGWYPLWDGKPKLAHIDVVRFPPDIKPEQAEKMNEFMKRGGGFALGALPNVDDAYSKPILETLETNLSQSFQLLQKSGVDLDLLEEQTMASTQCGLSGASPELSRNIHVESSKFQDIFMKTLEGSR